jgi:N-succinyldiaminopimelate aminotransferase
VQKASIAAWNDEAHVRGNRRLHTEKFKAVLPLIRDPLKAQMPDGGFYLWMRTPLDDAEFVRRLHHEYNVLVLPGSFLGREVNGKNPGSKHVRIALVAPLRECVEAIERIVQFARKL